MPRGLSSAENAHLGILSGLGWALKKNHLCAALGPFDRGYNLHKSITTNRGVRPLAPRDSSPPDDWNYGNYGELWGVMGSYGELWGIMGEL